jgi:hypothetical protein
LATFSPIITTSSPVTVTSGVPTITYNELLQSIKGGGYQDKIDTIYISASSFGQLSSNWALLTPTQSGSFDAKPVSYLIDPAQKQPTAFLDLKPYNFVLDTLTSVAMNMQPYSSVTLVVFADAQSAGQAFTKSRNAPQIAPQNNVINTNVTIVKETPKQNNEVAKKVFVAAASVSVIYLILNKL